MFSYFQGRITDIKIEQLTLIYTSHTGTQHSRVRQQRSASLSYTRHGGLIDLPLPLTFAERGSTRPTRKSLKRNNLNVYVSNCADARHTVVERALENSYTVTARLYEY